MAPTGLGRLQMGRLAQTRDGMAVFAETSAAERWLDGYEHA